MTIRWAILTIITTDRLGLNGGNRELSTNENSPNINKGIAINKGATIIQLKINSSFEYLLVSIVLIITPNGLAMNSCVG
jgi:hypothetical protein